MALKAYYDGGGKSDDLGCRFLTLGGFSAQEGTWSGFDADWISILRDKYKIVDDDGRSYFHMSEAWSLSGLFTVERGWNREKVKDVVGDLLQVIGKYRNYEHPEETDLLGFSCTVDLAAYRKVAPGIVGLKSPESLCVDWCTGLQFQRKPALKAGNIQFYFDRNEPFLHKINYIWNLRVDGQRTWWAKYVSVISSVEMSDVPAVQAADLLAWVHNRHYADPSQAVGSFYRIVFHLCAGIFHKYYDEGRCSK